MKKIVTCLLFSFLLVTSSSGQCQYNLDSYTHNDCFGDNSGSINLTLSNPNSTIQWSGPNSFISNNIDINNLFARYLILMEIFGKIHFLLMVLNLDSSLGSLLMMKVLIGKKFMITIKQPEQLEVFTMMKKYILRKNI